MTWVNAEVGDTELRDAEMGVAYTLWKRNEKVGTAKTWQENIQPISQSQYWKQWISILLKTIEDFSWSHLNFYVEKKKAEFYCYNIQSKSFVTIVGYVVAT